MSDTWLVTGALGCIGAWVVKLLAERGDRVVTFDLGDDPRRLRDVLAPELLAEVRLVQGDLTDGEAVHDALRESGARRVVHLAGLQVPFCKADPAAGARVNVAGTIHVLEAARELSLDRVVYASSAAVYGPPEDGRAPSEADPCDPRTHYGVFKRANEGNARVYFDDHGVSSVGLRPLTVYGVGRDQGLTSGPTTAMKAAVLGRPFQIGFQGATDFLWARDCAAAFVACAEGAPEGAHVWKIAVIAWAMLRDEKDWEPKRMIEVTESYGKMPAKLKETLATMKPKENSDQRKARLRREARQTDEQKQTRKGRPSSKKKRPSSNASSRTTKASPDAREPKKKSTPSKPAAKSRSKPRRAGKLVSRN